VDGSRRIGGHEDGGGEGGKRKEMMGLEVALSRRSDVFHTRVGREPTIRKILLFFSLSGRGHAGLPRAPNRAS